MVKNKVLQETKGIFKIYYCRRKSVLNTFRNSSGLLMDCFPSHYFNILSFSYLWFLLNSPLEPVLPPELPPFFSHHSLHHSSTLYFGYENGAATFQNVSSLRRHAGPPMQHCRREANELLFEEGSETYGGRWIKRERKEEKDKENDKQNDLVSIRKVSWLSVSHSHRCSDDTSSPQFFFVILRSILRVRNHPTYFNR